MPEDGNHDQKAYYEAVAALREKQIHAKERMRERRAALSFTEKVKILEKLRDRSLTIAASGLRRNNGSNKPGTSKNLE